eukprot:gene6546-1167_t
MPCVRCYKHFGALGKKITCPKCEAHFCPDCLTDHTCVPGAAKGSAKEVDRKDKADSLPTVIVVGGGYGGAEAAKELDKHCKVLLIDKKPYFFHNIGSLRACTDPEFSKNIVIPYTHLMNKGQFLQAEVVAVHASPPAVMLEDGTELRASHFVISTGSTYAFPLKMHELEPAGLVPEYKKVHTEIAAAKTVVVVGGGPTGVEMVGEIKDMDASKEVVLVHSRQQLLSDVATDPRVGQIALDKLKAIKGVRVMLGVSLDLYCRVCCSLVVRLCRRNTVPPSSHQCAIGVAEWLAAAYCPNLLGSCPPQSLEHRFVFPGQRELKMESGAAVDTDLVLLCMGNRVASSAYASSLEESKLTERKEVKVNPYLQVVVYAQLTVLFFCMVTKPSSKLTMWQATSNACSKGVSFFPFFGGLVFQDTVTSWVKGTDLIAGRQFKRLNESKPESLDQMLGNFENMEKAKKDSGPSGMTQKVLQSF